MNDERTPWKFEMHAHTSPASRCAVMRPNELAEDLHREGYDAVVVTDHYDPERFFGATKGRRFRTQMKDLFDGWREMAEAGAKYNIKVFQGSELRIERGNEDYLLYGFTEELAYEIGYLGGYTLKRVREILEPHGVLIVQAHPFRPYLNAADPSLLDGAEVYNGNLRHQNHNADALAFAQRNGLLMTAGSDCHQKGDPGRAWLTLPPAKNERELVQNLRERAKKPVDTSAFPEPRLP